MPMIIKGGLETTTQHLAMEYVEEGIRATAVRALESLDTSSAKRRRIDGESPRQWVESDSR